VELLLLAYIGPDQMMPLASLLATATGALLIGWNKLLKAYQAAARHFRRSERSAGAGQAPTSESAK